MKIANFTYSYPPLMTGISACVHSRVRQFLEWGHEVHLIYPQVHDGMASETACGQMQGLQCLSQYEKFSSTAFPTKPNPLRASHPEARSHRHWNDTTILDAFDPDVVICDEPAAIYGFSSAGLVGYRRPVGVEYALQTAKPVINLLHGDWMGYAEHLVGRIPVHLLRPTLRMLCRHFGKGYTKHFSPSKFMQQRYNTFYDGRLEYVPFHGADCDCYCPENIRHNPIPDVDDPVLLFTGRISPEKNVGQLIEAFALVKRRVSNVRLYLLGDGPSVVRLQRESRKQFGDAVTFVGSCFGDTLKGWYARADVYWTASITENFATTILEALASGTPVVASAAGGNIEQVEDGVSGYLVSPKSPQEMAERTISLLTDNRLRTEMSEQARKRGLTLDYSVSHRLLMDEILRLVPSADSRLPSNNLSQAKVLPGVRQSTRDSSP